MESTFLVIREIIREKAQLLGCREDTKWWFKNLWYMTLSQEKVSRGHKYAPFLKNSCEGNFISLFGATFLSKGIGWKTVMYMVINIYKRKYYKIKLIP